MSDRLLAKNELKKAGRVMGNMKAVMVTSNLDTAGFCAAAFKNSLFDFECASSAGKFRDALKSGFDAILLDIAGLEELTGFKTAEDACGHIRRFGRQKVIIVLSSVVLPPGKVVAILNSGANDVVSGEWRFRVIAEQVKALANFSAAGVKKSKKKISLDDGSITVNIAARRCFVMEGEGAAGIYAGIDRMGREVGLTRNEFGILSLLVSRKGALVTYMDFKNRLWPDRLFQAEVKHSLLQHITDLRRKLGPAGARIENVWGEGFRINNRQ